MDDKCQSSRARARRLAGIGALLSMLALAAAIPWAFPPARALAGHAWPATYGQHVAYIHDASAGHSWADEDICYESYSGSLTDSALRSKLVTSVLGSSGWDLTGSSKIDLWISSDHCDSYADDYWVDIRYDVSDGGGCGSASTANPRYPIYLNGSVIHYNQYELSIRTCHINGSIDSQDSTLNHELGHAWGLKDPPFGGPCDYAGWWWGSSVMHQYTDYGCPTSPPNYIRYPTSYEKDTIVSDVMPVHW